MDTSNWIKVSLIAALCLSGMFCVSLFLSCFDCYNEVPEVENTYSR
jgi:hypothetical protein